MPQTAKAANKAADSANELGPGLTETWGMSGESAPKRVVTPLRVLRGEVGGKVPRVGLHHAGSNAKRSRRPRY